MRTVHVIERSRKSYWEHVSAAPMVGPLYFGRAAPS